MTTLDHSTFVALGRAMAAKNGYTAEQSSDLYITDGDQIDWLYATYRIFTFTYELYPSEQSTVWLDHYPDDSKIPLADGPQPERHPPPDQPRRLPVRGPRRRLRARRLRPAVRRPRDQPRLGPQRRRHRHGDGRAVGDLEPGGHRPRTGRSSSGRRCRARRPSSPARWPGPAPTRTTSTAARRASAAARSASRRAPRASARSPSATTSPTARARHPMTRCG